MFALFILLYTFFSTSSLLSRPQIVGDRELSFVKKERKNVSKSTKKFSSKMKEKKYKTGKKWDFKNGFPFV